jgi:hypothetical protein
MLPLFVAVTGNSNDARFAVTEFSIVGRASTKLITANFESQPTGCVVACSGKFAAVGAYKQSSVWIYDLSNPASPTIQNTLNTTLGAGNGIGTLSLDGTNLLVGQFNGPSVVLLDINTGAVLATGTVGDFPGGITALALKGKTAIVSGLDNFDVLNYDSTHGKLTPTPYVGEINFTGNVTCDFDGSTAVVGYTDIDGLGYVYSFSIADGAVVPGTPVQYGAMTGVSSLTISGKQVVAGSIGELLVILISLGSPHSNGFVSVDNSDGLPGAVVKFYGNSNLAAANNNGVIFFSSRAWPNPTQFGAATGFGLSKDGFTTVGFTEVEQFRVLPIPPWMQPVLHKIFG